ncbi:Dot/Icm T4SS effector AnkY/LegA9 [Legionella impletisoli]|uniref:Ankyrin repeat-containing protein n=1 Tax=Legionella impletisoli TaxID=343510 RepID=A0A917NCM1_9GAMM|nr:Dot/Icm T4SS effector AnkY/LegA9 [Legionella impletisoli]GGI88272.1 hypothetical protein GCM10007966_16270 [Legionella impletisoli]
MKVILVYANCVKAGAKGDFVLAGNIARDLAIELRHNGRDIDVVLTSTLEGIERFKSLYDSIDGMFLSIEGLQIQLVALEEFDAHHYEVVAFIEANRCKHAPAELIKNILSPHSELFILNAADREIRPREHYIENINHFQPGLYTYFPDVHILYTGLGVGRIGLPSIPASSDLPSLNAEEEVKIPKHPFGLMYLSGDPEYCGSVIAQYMQMTNLPEYVLVGGLVHNKAKVEATIMERLLLNNPESLCITYHQTLSNVTMRHMAAQSHRVVVSMGVMSTLEAFRDDKLPFYHFNSNITFAKSYLLAVQSLCRAMDASENKMSQLIFSLAGYLFSIKPLKPSQLNQLRSLLAIEPVSEGLVRVNQQILEQANGKVARHLLGFMSNPAKSSTHQQCISICLTLRTKGEVALTFDEALRRAAEKGMIFELKVLLTKLSINQINKSDRLKRTALHYAVLQQKHDCIRLLIKHGAILDVQDHFKKTPLDYAIIQDDERSIEILSGAKLTSSDGEKDLSDSSSDPILIDVANSFPNLSLI